MIILLLSSVLEQNSDFTKIMMVFNTTILQLININMIHELFCLSVLTPHNAHLAMLNWL